jgi:hypothetical protein
MLTLRLAAAGALLLLAACAPEYTYTPPATEQGRACVSGCQARQADCRALQDRQSAQAQAQCAADRDQRQGQCEHDSQIEYDACLQYAKTDADRKGCKRKSCDQPACWNGSNYGQCDTDYRACYQNCGGVIGILKQ